MGKKTEKTRSAVIQAAVKVFAEKGFRASTVGDLAREAGLGEATIYNHFKNKLEVLLALPLPFIRDFMEKCQEQLAGIKDPEERMRKYIWQALRWSQSHRDVIKILLTDIVPTPEYYSSPTHEQMMQAAALPSRILAEGQEAGRFRKDVGPAMFIRVFFGTVTYVILNRFMYDADYELLEDFDDIAGCVLAAISRSNAPAEIDIQQIKDKKERILLAGEKLFSQKTSAHTTIAEIAKEAHVADGTIYDYFKNKDDLLFFIFNKRMKDFLATYDQTLAPQSPEALLKMAVFHFFSWVENNRAWARIYITDVVSNPNFFLSRAYDLKVQHDGRLLEIYEKGKKEGVFSADLKVELFLAVVFGPIYFLCLPWALLDGENSLVARLDEVYTLQLRAMKGV